MATSTETLRRADWPSIVWSGVIGGAAMLMTEMILVPLALGMSPWGPPRMMAAIVLGQSVLPPPATFDAGILIVAMMVHFALSIVYAGVIDLVVRRLDVAPAILLGLVFGLGLYLVNFYVFTGVFPWFAMARGWVSVVAHLMYGGATVAAYEGLHKARERRHPAPAT